MNKEDISKLSDEELTKVVTEDFKSYSPEEINAVIQELEKRDYDLDKEVMADINRYLQVAKLSNDELIEIMENLWNHPQSLWEEVEKEIDKRKIKIDKKDFENTIKKMKPMGESGQIEKGRSVHMEINERFPVLSTVAKVLQVLGWIIVVIGGVLLVFVSGAEALRSTTPNSGHHWGGGDWMTLISNIGITVCGFLVIAIAEIIGVLFAIEKNTRK